MDILLFYISLQIINIFVFGVYAPVDSDLVLYIIFHIYAVICGGVSLCLSVFVGSKAKESEV
jgi:hypothetical protein